MDPDCIEKICVLFFVLSIVQTIWANTAIQDSKDSLLCRDCGADAAETVDLFDYFSPDALMVENHSLFQHYSVNIQLLENNLKERFEVVTVFTADCEGFGEWNTGDSWYPGFAWKHCMCKHCGHQIGWIFEPIEYTFISELELSEEGFYLLMLNKIHSAYFADSLIVIPSSYDN